MKLRRTANPKSTLLATATTLGLCLAATPAFAEEGAYAGPWHVDLSFSARATELPAFDAPVGDTLIVGFPGLIGERFKPTLLGGELTAAYQGTDGWRIELGGGYWSGDDEVSVTPVFDEIAGYGLSVTDLTGLDGTLVGANELIGDSVYASVESELLEGRLRLARRFSAGDVMLKPFAGVLYERSIQDYAASFRLSEPAVNNLEIPYDLSQEVESSRIGGEVGLQVSVSLGQRWRLDTGAAFALYSQDSSLDAQDCLARGAFSPGFACDDATTPQYERFIDTTAHDDDDRVATRVKLEAGLSYLASFGTIGVSGFAQYDSDVAGIDNPLLSQEQFLGPDPTRDVPAQLTFADAWSYGGKVKLSIPLQ